jgi:group I intron endonuclease
MAESGIYEIVNLVNGKRYVGSAVEFARRWRGHRSCLVRGKHHSRYLQNAWNKYGEAAFDFRVIELCDPQILIEREQFHINERAEYNCSPSAGSILGLKLTEEQKQRRRGRKQSPEWVAKRLAAHIGAKRSPETRAKIAAKARGRKLPPRSAEYRQKISERTKGRQMSPEHMAKLQEGRRNRIFTDQQRMALSEALKQSYQDGRRSRERPPEYRAKIAAALRERAKDPKVRERLSRQARDAAQRRKSAS